MLRLFTIVGARPQFIKAAALSRAVRKSFSGQVEETLIHTGQHYDENMSDVFFREMEIPAPAYHLEIGSGTHGAMTGKMIAAIETVLAKEKPDILLVYGDTNSTLAGALAAAKLHIPVAHVEAGLRSYKKSMPEEVNRRLCDHLSTFLFPPTHIAFQNLVAEGIVANRQLPVSADNPLIENVGDVMLDNALYFAGRADTRLHDKLEITGRTYILATVHRDFNTDDPARMHSIFHALLKTASALDTTIILPLHPRTRNILEQPDFAGLKKMIDSDPRIRIISPASYFETLSLLQNARLVITDSGGLQKESYFFRKPCVILRAETEWTEIVQTGNAVCADADEGMILQHSSAFFNRMNADFPSLYGDGAAAGKIIQTLLAHFPL